MFFISSFTGFWKIWNLQSKHSCYHQMLTNALLCCIRFRFVCLRIKQSHKYSWELFPTRISPLPFWESGSEVAQLCLTLCDPMDCSLPGSSLHGIFQARILEWVAISFSRRPSQPRDWTWVSHIVGWCFTIWATRKVCFSQKTHAHLRYAFFLSRCLYFQYICT